MDLLSLGALVKTARQEQKFTQGDLVARAAISRARLDALENGRLSDIGFKKLIRVLNVLGLDIRITELNHRRPTLDDLVEENDNAPGLGGR